MVHDTELLRRYVADHSEAAFTELVQRHINLVYAAAVREMAGDTALAQDVCQAVFIELARKGFGLTQHPALAGWLYSCVRKMAANLRRAESRRHHREQRVHAMSLLHESQPEDAHWTSIQPVLDDALHELNEKDRTALVLRFLEQRTIEEVGVILGLNKSAAHMRIDRALEKLRILLSERGITSSTPGLVAGLAIGAAVAAPKGLAATVAGTALTSATVGTGAPLTLFKIMTMTKLKATVIVSLIVAGLSTPVILEHNAFARVRSERNALETRNRQLEDEVSQLQSDKQQLSKLMANSNNLDHSQKESELLRLRGEVGSLLRQNQDLTNSLRLVAAQSGNPTAETQPNFGLSFEPAVAQNRGFGSVPAALQTIAWGALSGNPETICRLEGKKATTSDGSPAPWADQMVRFYQDLFKDVGSVQITDMTPKSDGSMDVQMQLNRKSGDLGAGQSATTAIATLKRGEAGWQVAGWGVEIPPDASGRVPDARELQEAARQARGQ